MHLSNMTKYQFQLQLFQLDFRGVSFGSGEVRLFQAKMEKTGILLLEGYSCNGSEDQHKKQR